MVRVIFLSPKSPPKRSLDGALSRVFLLLWAAAQAHAPILR